MPDTATQPDFANEIERGAAQFLNLPSVARGDVWKIIEMSEKGHDRAGRQFEKRMLFLVATWMVSYAISANAVSEATIASFKLNRLTLFVLISPIAVAILYHAAINIIASSEIGGRVADLCFQKLFPDASNDQINAISPPTGALGFEGLLTRKAVPASGCLWFSSGLIVTSIMFGPAILYFHVLYLALESPSSPFSRIAVTLISGIVFLRCLLIAFLDLKLARAAKGTFTPSPHTSAPDRQPSPYHPIP